MNLSDVLCFSFVHAFHLIKSRPKEETGGLGGFVYLPYYVLYPARTRR